MKHRPLLWIAVSFGVGILANEYISLSFVVLFSLTLLMIVLYLLTQGRQIPATIFVLLTMISLGAVSSENYQTLPKEHISFIARYYRRDPIRVEGIVVSEVLKRDSFKGKKTTFTLELHSFKTRWGWRGKTGKILVNLFRDEDIRYGDYLRLEGKLHRPFEFSSESAFSYKAYLRRRGIWFILSVKKQGEVRIQRSHRGNPLKAASLRVRHRLSTVLKDNLSKNESGIMRAVLLGERYNIPKHIRELFQLSGTAHILAVSGLHVGFVAFLIFLFLKMLPIPRKAQYILTIFCLIGYALLTGGRPSVVRSVIMITVFLVGFLIERETDPVNTLAFAAIIILIMNPMNLFDVGFQLSFTSVFSILSFYPKMMRIFPRSSGEAGNGSKSFFTKPVRYLVQSFFVSTAAYLGVGGLIAYYFHTVTPVSMIANLLVIPLISIIVMLGFGLLMAGTILPACAFAFAVCIKVLLNLMVVCIFLVTQIPGAYFRFNHAPLWVVMTYYVSLLGVLFFVDLKTKIT